MSLIQKNRNILLLTFSSCSPFDCAWQCCFSVGPTEAMTMFFLRLFLSYSGFNRRFLDRSTKLVKEFEVEVLRKITRALTKRRRSLSQYQLSLYWRKWGWYLFRRKKYFSMKYSYFYHTTMKFITYYIYSARDNDRLKLFFILSISLNYSKSIYNNLIIVLFWTFWFLKQF